MLLGLSLRRLPAPIVNGARQWRSTIGWGILGTVTSLSCWYWLRQASTIVPSDHGWEFINLHTEFLGLGILVFLSTGFVPAFADRRRWLSWFLSLALTVVVLAKVNSEITEVEFVRTPPCRGIHSVDPGSGFGCPDGMQSDFTVEQLREYYRNSR